jgi:hypothetical protein
LFASHIHPQWTIPGIIQSIQKVHKLPLKLVAYPAQQTTAPNNADQCKITIGANKPIVDLNSLFPGKPHRL